LTLPASADGSILISELGNSVLLALAFDETFIFFLEFLPRRPGKLEPLSNAGVCLTTQPANSTYLTGIDGPFICQDGIANVSKLDETQN